MSARLRFTIPVLTLICLITPGWGNGRSPAGRGYRPPPSNGLPQKLPEATEQAVQISLSVDSVAMVDIQAAQQAKARQEYVKANQAWEAKAMEIRNQMIEETNQFLPLGLGKHGTTTFPEAVHARMPPRPQYAAEPAATPLAWKLVLKNVSDSPVYLGTQLSANMAWISIDITGPGAVPVQSPHPSGLAQMRVGKSSPRLPRFEQPITLQPGQQRTIELSKLTHGMRLATGDWAIVEPGQYTLSVRYQTSFELRRKHDVVTDVSATATFTAELSE